MAPSLSLTDFEVFQSNFFQMSVFRDELIAGVK